MRAAYNVVLKKEPIRWSPVMPSNIPIGTVGSQKGNYSNVISFQIIEISIYLIKLSLVSD